MDDYLTFEGQIIPLVWGKSTYTILPIPDEITEILVSRGAKRVEGEIGDYPVNLALTKAPVIAQTFLYTGKAFLKDAGLSPGDDIEVRLRPAPEALVEVPDALMLALRQAGASEAWDALTPGRQRGLINTITSAKRPETRAKRIAALIAEIT